MSPFVTSSMVFLVALIALVEPAPDVRVDVAEHTVLPGVTYRVERRWHVVADAEIAEQCQAALVGIQNLRPLPRMTNRTWWITKQCKTTWTSMSNSFADQRLRPRLALLFRTMPLNWYLSDLGITRNGKALPIPPDLAASIWQHQVLRDRQVRTMNDLMTGDLLAINELDFSPLSDDSIDDYIHERLNREFTEVSGNTGEPGSFFKNEILIETDGSIEAVYIAPYLLLIRDDALVAVLGGEGRFDRIPADWEYLRP